MLRTNCFSGATVLVTLAALLCAQPTQAARVKANVRVIIDKLPIEKEQKMQDFDSIIKQYIESVDWLEEEDEIPLEISLQLFLSESPTNVEDRYNCEFLISSSDVQYFDKRVRFAYQPGDVIIYNDQAVDPLTGILNFYMNLVLGSELDKYRKRGGDIYYKRAQDFASLGKFVRTEFIRGWTERSEITRRIMTEPFITFREMKDYFFFGLYVLEEEDNEKQARASILKALDLLVDVTEKAKAEMEEHKQCLSAHYNEFIDLFKNYHDRDNVFAKLMEIDPERSDQYKEHLSRL